MNAPLPAHRQVRTVHWQGEPLFVAASTSEADRIVEVLNLGAEFNRPADAPPLPVRVMFDQHQLDVAVQTLEQVRADLEVMGLLASQPAAQRLDLMRRALTSVRRTLVERT